MGDGKPPVLNNLALRVMFRFKRWSLSVSPTSKGRKSRSWFYTASLAAIAAFLQSALCDTELCYLVSTREAVQQRRITPKYGAHWQAPAKYRRREGPGPEKPTRVSHGKECTNPGTWLLTWYWRRLDWLRVGWPCLLPPHQERVNMLATLESPILSACAFADQSNA